MNQLTQINTRLPIACRNGGFESGGTDGMGAVAGFFYGNQIDG